MSGLEALERYIYHEKQEHGSMLCAQHALNVLFQQPMYDASQLAAIATELDEQEAAYDDDNKGATSTNMDDSGFFSIQVLSSALRVWGISLERWRSESMRPYQGNPQAQLAFIFNRSEHWYTLRRFGNANPDFTDDFQGEVHWFDLDSMKTEPVWVSSTYLGMQLQSAEEAGYSIFAVVQADPSASLALPRTRADQVASTLPQPTSAASTRTRRNVQELPVEGFEDEDMELQAVLAASMAEHESSGSMSSGPPANPAQFRASLNSNSAPDVFDEEIDENQAPLAAPAPFDYRRFQLEQQQAARAGVIDNEGQGAQIPNAWAERRARERAEEEEQIRQAIALSRRQAREEGVTESDDEEEDEAYVPPGVGAATLEAASARPPPSGDFVPSFGGQGSGRNYDDEDAELQRALAASMGYAVPEFYSPERPAAPVIRHSDTLDVLPALPGFSSRPKPPPVALQPTMIESQVEDEGDSSIVVEAQAPKEPDLDEMRRKRLERLGQR